jgi:hypothetical protein
MALKNHLQGINRLKKHGEPMLCYPPPRRDGGAWDVVWGRLRRPGSQTTRDTYIAGKGHKDTTNQPKSVRINSLKSARGLLLERE